MTTERVSINAQTSFEAQTTDAVEGLLFIFDHPSLDAPIRLATIATERLSLNPLKYCIRSSWLGTDPQTEPFEAVNMEAEYPSDLEDTPAATTIIFSNLGRDLAKVLLSFTSFATVHIALIMSTTPDKPERQSRNLKLAGVDGNVDEITLTISRQAIEDENVPMDRFTKHRFPGLFR